MAAPTVRAVGAVNSGSGTTRTVAVPSGTAEGDLLIILGEHDSASAMSASGWTEIAFVSNGGGGGGTTNTTLTLLGKLAGASEGSASVTVNTDHSTCRMIGITAGTHGVTNVATDIVVGADNTGSVATGTALGITVTADSLILICGTTTRDANSTAEYSAFTNANLASIAEQMDNVINVSNGGGIGMASGTCAGTSTGNSTYTGTAVNWAAVQIGIPPVAAAAAIPPILVMARR